LAPEIVREGEKSKGKLTQRENSEEPREEAYL